MQAISILKRAIVTNEGSFRLIILLIFLSFDMLIMVDKGSET
jgi:hypothetical protein